MTAADDYKANLDCLLALGMQRAECNPVDDTVPLESWIATNRSSILPPCSKITAEMFNELVETIDIDLVVQQLGSPMLHEGVAWMRRGQPSSILEQDLNGLFGAPGIQRLRDLLDRNQWGVVLNAIARLGEIEAGALMGRLAVLAIRTVYLEHAVGESDAQRDVRAAISDALGHNRLVKSVKRNVENGTVRIPTDGSFAAAFTATKRAEGDYKANREVSRDLVRLEEREFRAGKKVHYLAAVEEAAPDPLAQAFTLVSETLRGRYAVDLLAVVLDILLERIELGKLEHDAATDPQERKYLIYWSEIDARGQFSARISRADAGSTRGVDEFRKYLCTYFHVITGVFISQDGSGPRNGKAVLSVDRVNEFIDPIEIRRRKNDSRFHSGRFSLGAAFVDALFGRKAQYSSVRLSTLIRAGGIPVHKWQQRHRCQKLWAALIAKLNDVDQSAAKGSLGVAAGLLADNAGMQWWRSKALSVITFTDDEMLTLFDFRFGVHGVDQDATSYARDRDDLVEILAGLVADGDLRASYTAPVDRHRPVPADGSFVRLYLLPGDQPLRDHLARVASMPRILHGPVHNVSK